MKKSTARYVKNFLEDLLKDTDKSPEALRAAKKKHGQYLSTLDKQTDEVLDRKGSNTVRNVRPVNRDNLEQVGESREKYPGGAYLDPVSGENITAKSFGKARISTENKTGVDHTEVKPSMKVADEVDETLKGSLYKYEGQDRKNKASTKVNLLKPTSTKKKRNWEWKSRDPDIEDTNQLVSIDHRGKHFYALNTRFSKGAKLETYPDNPDEPRLRPLLPEAKLKFGKVIGYINKSSSKGIKTHPVYKDVTAYSEGGMPVGKKAVAKYAVNFLKKIFDDLPDKVKKDLPDQPKDGGLRVFHGSNKEYQTMDISTARKQDQFLGEGFYFTIDPKIAKEYANMRAINQLEKLTPEQRARLPELLEKKVITPKEIKEGAVHNFKGEIVKVDGVLNNKNVEGIPLKNEGQNIKEFTLDVTNPYVVKTDKQRRDLKKNIDKIKAEGYDSVVFDSFKDRSKQIMVFPEYMDKIKKVGAVDFNKGGTTMKNDPPVGSTPSEVADDIPAMISEGEFVIPADVVRYVGLDKIRAMMQEAKHGLACMEDEGLIVDVDEEGRPQKDQKEKSDDKVAIIETVQIEKVDPMMTQMAEGGMTDKDSPVSSPILNPENKPVMAEGGIFLSPDGSLNMNEGGMPMQMEGMMMEGASDPMMEEMPSEEPEMAMPPEFADEMPPEEAEPMGDAPMMNAPVAQEFNGQPHLLAYLNNEELGALQSAGRGLDENGEQILSPEGIPVFVPNDASESPNAANDTGAGTEDPGADMGGFGGPDNDVGDPGGSSQDENEPKLSKKIKEELDPEKNDDKTYVSGVGFIDKYIENRLNNPLQGKPAYAVATAAGGGLMRTPMYLDEGGFVPNIDKDGEINEASPDEDPIPSVASTPAESPVASEAPVESETSVTSSVPEGLMQDPFAPNQVRSALSSQYEGQLDEPTLQYLSNNRDVLENIVGGKPTLDPEDLMDASKKHFDEFGKNEDRMGDGLYLAQQRLPDLINEDGNPSVIAGAEGYYDAAKILETQPNISDESLDYLTKNKDVFRNAEDRVSSEEGTTYDDVAKQHYELYGKAEGDRRGTEGLDSFFSRPDLGEDTLSTMPIQDTMVDTDEIGNVAYSSSTFDESGDVQNAGDEGRGVPKGGYDASAGRPQPDPDLGLKNSLQSKPEGGTGFFTRETLQDYKDQLSRANMGNLDPIDFDSQFVHKGGNTYDFKSGATLAGYLGGFRDAQGNQVSIDKAVYQKGARKGQPLTQADVIRVGRNRLSSIDESGN